MSRKWLLILLAGVLVLALAACTGAVDVTTTPVVEGTPEHTDADSSEGHDDDTDVDTGEGHDDDTDADSGADEDAVIDAAAIFSDRCSSCHGAEREGGGGPPLLPATLTKEASVYINTITNGSGPMPTWGGKLSADEINALVEYIMSEPQ